VSLSMEGTSITRESELRNGATVTLHLTTSWGARRETLSVPCEAGCPRAAHDSAAQTPTTPSCSYIFRAPVLTAEPKNENRSSPTH
jgi:hypothetical protein